VAGGSKILIDNGLSYRQLQLRAAQVGESLDDLKAVFVTHEHSDHVLGLGVLSRKMGVPIYMTAGTAENLPVKLTGLAGVQTFESGDTIALNGVQLHSFRVSHDAADPVSYVVEHDDTRLGVAADLGLASQLVKQRLAGAHALVLESNYCPNMLRRSSYPPAIRQRISGRTGHLSNAAACSLLKVLRHEQLRLVVLVHISMENNTHETAMTMATQVLAGSRARICCAEQDHPTEMFEVLP